jgi:hypothetical protein
VWVVETEVVLVSVVAEVPLVDIVSVAIVSVVVIVPVVDIVSVAIVSVAIVSTLVIDVSVVAESVVASSFLQLTASIATTRSAIRVRTRDFFIAYFLLTVFQIDDLDGFDACGSQTNV